MHWEGKEKIERKLIPLRAGSIDPQYFSHKKTILNLKLRDNLQDSRKIFSLHRVNNKQIWSMNWTICGGNLQNEEKQNKSISLYEYNCCYYHYIIRTT